MCNLGQIKIFVLLFWFYLSLMFTYSETFMCLAWTDKKIEFWRTPILMPQIFSIFMFPSYLFVYPEILMCLAYLFCKFHQSSVSG